MQFHRLTDQAGVGGRALRLARPAQSFAGPGDVRAARSPAIARMLLAIAPGLLAIPLALCVNVVHADSQRVPTTGIDWVALEGFSIARTETTIGQFRRFVEATGLLTRAERLGGGQVYEAGWVTKPGWSWASPYGQQYIAHDDEPAAHVTFDEAQAFCRWAGGQLPTDAQWRAAAYREQRNPAPVPFITGRVYPFPSGDSPAGAQCLDDCGANAALRAVPHGAALTRGRGHARTSQTPAGVNGLHDMGGNLWEWVDDPPGAGGNAERLTRGGSWWYGSDPMRAGHRQSKPGDTSVIYIGFRCARASR